MIYVFVSSALWRILTSLRHGLTTSFISNVRWSLKKDPQIVALDFCFWLKNQIQPWPPTGGFNKSPVVSDPIFYFMRSFRLFSFVIWTVSFIMLWTVGLSCQLCVRVIATWLADSSFHCVAVIYVLVVFIDCGADCQILQGFDQTTCL